MNQLITVPPALALEGRLDNPALRRKLSLALTNVLDTSALLFAQLSCPALLEEPVTAACIGGVHATAGRMYVRTLTLPDTGQLDGGALVVASGDQQSLLHAGVLPMLLAMIIDGESERQCAEAAGKAALDLAHRDPATGLGNRRAWMNTLDLECARAARTSRPLAVIVLDLDGLTAINDSHGHAAGDQLIALTAAELTAGRRATDVVCRLGGDEFGIAAPDTDALHARLLVRRLRALLHAQGVEASAGWAVSDTLPAGAHAHKLWRQADQQMYQDKRERR